MYASDSLVFFQQLQTQYKPVYDVDTVIEYPEYETTLPLPMPVTSHLEFQTTQSLKGESRNVSDFDWMTIVLLLAYLIMAFARYNFPKRVNQLVESVFVKRSRTHLHREGNPFNEQVALALGLIYLLTSSLLIFVLLERYHWLPVELVRSELLYIFIVIINAAFWLLKAIANRLLAHIFKTYEATSNYLLNNLLFSFVLGIFLLITLPFVIYIESDLILNLVAGSVVVLLFYKVIRGILIGLSIARFPAFYLFLYLCMLEVAPLLLLAKVFITYTNI